MKISFVITDGYKQVMFTPESDYERTALKMIAPGDTLAGVVKWGTYDDKPSQYGVESVMCQGGYIRRFAQADSLMFVIKDEEKKDNPLTPTNHL